MDDPEVVEALRRELPLVVGELVASMETMDCEQARRARDNLIIYAVGLPPGGELKLFSALISMAEAVVRGRRDPCRGLSLLERGLAWGDLVARALGAEVVEAARGLKARLARECGRAARERGQLGVR